MNVSLTPDLHLNAWIRSLMEVPGFVPDGSSQALVNQNDQLIQKNCSKTISEFK